MIKIVLVSKPYILAVGLILLFASCTEVIDFDLNDSNIKTVIEGGISTYNQKHRIRITTTASYYANEAAPVVSGAEVSITDGTTTWQLTENPIGSGNYFTDSMAAVIGVSYTITIKTGTDIFIASSIAPQGGTLDSLAVKQLFLPEDFGGGIDSSWTASVWGQDPPGIKNYYMWYYYVNDSLITDNYGKLFFLDDTGIDGAYIPGYTIFRVGTDIMQAGDTFRIEGYTVPKEYFDFVRSCLLETLWRGDNPWDGPPANLPTNYSGGAVGYFWAGDVAQKTIVVQ